MMINLSSDYYLYGGIIFTIIGILFTYDTYKHPYKRKGPENLNLISYMRGFSTIILGLIFLFFYFK